MLLASKQGEERPKLETKSTIKDSKSKSAVDFSTQGLPMNVTHYFSRRQLEKLKNKIKMIGVVSAIFFIVFVVFYGLVLQDKGKILDEANEQCAETQKSNFM
jgi:hypothetical protein